MVLTVSSDLENISTAESITNWVAIGAQSPLLEPDFFVQGSNCISRAVSGAGTEKGMWYDLVTGGHAALNFNSGGAYENKLIYIWMKVQTRGLIDTMAAGGMKIRIGSSLTAYSDFNVAGNDYGVPDNEGWICFIIDPTLTATATSGGGANLGAISHIGGTIKTTTTAKGQNFGIDRIAVGRGEIRAYGTSTSEKGFKDLSDWDWSSNTTQRWGLMTVKGGIIYCKCKIVLGDDSSTNSTTFTSNDETLVWEAPMYYQGTTRQKSVPDEDEDGLEYWGVTLQGNTTGTNSFTFGTIVGSDKGRSGDTFIASTNDFLSTPARPGCRFLVTDTDIDSLSMYGCTFRNFERTSPNNAIDFSGVPASEDCFSNVFDGCGRLYFGAMDIRNCTILNSYTDTNDGAVKWDSVTDLTNCLFLNNIHSIVFESATGSPFSFTDITFGTTALAVRNESNANIDISISGGNTPTAENAGTSTTDITSSITITVGPVVDGSEVRAYLTGTTTEVDGEESSSGGTVALSLSSGVGVDIVVYCYNPPMEPREYINKSFTSSQTFDPVQRTDRNFSNPA